MADPKQTLSTVLANPPTIGGPQQRSPIGIPAGFVPDAAAPRRSIGRAVGDPDYLPPGAVREPYRDGDEWQPATLAPEKIAAIQRGLATAGLIGATQKFRLGLWDEATRNAYRDLLAYANSRGLDDQSALHEYANAPQPEGGQREPLVKHVPSATELRDVVDTIARATLGRHDTLDRDAMVAGYQAAVASKQQEAYDLDPTGGTVEEAPSADAYFKEELRRRHPAEAGAHDLADQYGGFEKMLGGVTPNG